MTYTLKHYAHLGDAVWELFVRELILQHSHNQKQMHDLTVANVNAEFQSALLENLEKPETSGEFAREFSLKEDEKELVRRGRNLPTTINKKNNQKIHRAATAFEVLVGYLYVNNKERLDGLYERVKQDIILV